MKPILFVLSLALSALACMNDAARDDAGPEAGSAGARQSSIENNDFLAPERPDTPSCMATCAESHDSCVSAAEDAVSECECYDSNISCEYSCGQQGALIQC
jgi:hypothetical protein